jgi:two-component system sensor histidine kinase DesK
VESVSRAALKEVREAIRGYRPTLADELTRARALLDAAQIGATIESTLDVSELPAHAGVEEVLALALREAVTNVVRHSGASKTSIHAWRETATGNAALEVADDGRGATRPEGSGLRGMRERVEALDGRVISSVSGGTRLRIVVPLSANAQRVSA